MKIKNLNFSLILAYLAQLTAFYVALHTTIDDFFKWLFFVASIFITHHLLAINTFEHGLNKGLTDGIDSVYNRVRKVLGEEALRKMDEALDKELEEIYSMKDLNSD